jgi:hypothetical protein
MLGANIQALTRICLEVIEFQGAELIMPDALPLVLAYHHVDIAAALFPRSIVINRINT